MKPKEPWPKWLYDPCSRPAKILNRIYVADLIYLAFGGMLAFLALYGFNGCYKAASIGSSPGAEQLKGPPEQQERKDKCATSPKPH